MHTTLSQSELIPDRMLYALRSDDCGARRKGRLSDHDATLLCNLLPDICGEILALRRLYDAPLQRRRTVTDTHLCALVRHIYPKPNGPIGAAETRFLALALPAICDDLLRLRSLSAGKPHQSTE